MSRLTGGIFNLSDKLQMASLEHRHKRGNVLAANIANSETPGYRAVGYDFEDQLASIAGIENTIPMKVSHPSHYRNGFTTADGKIEAEVFVRPTESIPEDGNTVDVDGEMVQMAENQILFRSAVESLNRKIGMIRYAINGGR